MIPERVPRINPITMDQVLSLMVVKKPCNSILAVKWPVTGSLNRK